MAFFENLGKKVGEAAQTAAKKSNEFIEVNKLNSSISTEEESIKKIYLEIGKRVYENHLTNDQNNIEYKELFEEIDGHEQAIKNLKIKIIEIKKTKVCQECNSEIDFSITFCPKCGAKQENNQKADHEFIITTCPSCGADLQEGAAFCGLCGHKIGS